ncbi:uncharacterized [Tachysurus ichikawai]
MTGSPDREHMRATSLIPGVKGYTVPPWPNLKTGNSHRRTASQKLPASETGSALAFGVGIPLGKRFGTEDRNRETCAGRKLDSPFSSSALPVRQ